jgi:hypothetical protein
MKRIKGCEEVATNYVEDNENGEVISIDWEPEEEA